MNNALMECFLIEVFFQGYGHWEHFYSDGEEPSIDNPPEVWPITVEGQYYGVFCLNSINEMTYSYTGSLEGITSLKPSISHPDSNFIKQKISDNPDHCRFYIDCNKKMTLILVGIAKAKEVKTKVTEIERNTMLKLIIGMAMDAYGYNPANAKNNATGNNKNSISAKLALKNISVSDDTIRKYLDKAKDVL